jgi:imidazoleglycerol-phosphate dehydratase
VAFFYEMLGQNSRSCARLIFTYSQTFEPMQTRNSRTNFSEGYSIHDLEIPSRIASVHRVTGETDVQVSLNLDGQGTCMAKTGIPFLDHMLHQISSHGLIDLDVQATGDIEIDDHHTNEDVGITLGQALMKALGDRKGIVRFGHFIAPLDEALVQVSLDFSGRPHLSYGLQIPTERVGTYDTQLVREFFVAVVNHAQMTLHIRQLDGINSHHIIEATFKAFARAMRMAVEIDPRRAHTIPSSKGVL